MSRDAEVEKLKAQIEEWDAHLDQLESEARRALTDAKSSFEQQIAELRQKRDAAQATLEEIQESAKVAGEDLEGEADEAVRKDKKSDAERGANEAQKVDTNETKPVEEAVVEATARGVEHLIAIVLGFILSILGVAMTFSVVLIWLGIPLGVVGILMLLWGLLAWRQR